jgi:AcrR family transcriptional regulator
MVMENDIKMKLAISIKEQMRTMALDKIYITDIVNSARVSRQSFYRNFKDKYDLVNWYFYELVSQSFEEMGISNTLRGSLILKFNFIRSESVFFSQAFKSTDYNSLIEYDYEYILDFYTQKLKTVYLGEIPDDIHFLLEFYCHASITMTVDWLNNKMVRSSEKMADLLIRSMPPELTKLLESLL